MEQKVTSCVVSGQKLLAFGGIVDQWEGYWIGLQRDDTARVRDGFRWLDSRLGFTSCVVVALKVAFPDTPYVADDTPWQAAEPNNLDQHCAWSGYTGSWPVALALALWPDYGARSWHL